MATAKKPEVKEEAPAVKEVTDIAPPAYRTLSVEDEARVNTAKSKFNDTISYLKALRDSQHGSEVQRMFSIAITEAETASMWAVKAITWRG